MIFSPTFYTKSRMGVAIKIARYKRQWPNSVLVGYDSEYVDGEGYMTVVEFEDSNYWLS
jgi:hypothetical protein